jgi:hypothetical protein
MPFSLAKVGEIAYGSNNPDDKEMWLEHFNKHNERVKQVIPANQLLVIDITTTTCFWRTICSFLNETKGPCASPDSSPAPLVHTKEKKEHERDEIVAYHSAKEFPEVNAPSPFAYVSVITMDVKLLSTLLGRPVTDHLLLFHSFIETVEALREQGVKRDVILLVYGPMLLEQSERAMLDRLHVYFHPVEGFETWTMPVSTGYHGFKADHAAYQRVKLHILRLKQYSRLLFFDPMTRLSRGCDAMLDSMHGDFSVHLGDTVKAPFDTRAFMIIPSTEVFIDLSSIAKASPLFSVQEGWLGVGGIPAWGPADDLKHNWEFATLLPDIGLLYFYYFMSPVQQEGKVHASAIDSEDWVKCVPLAY